MRLILVLALAAGVVGCDVNPTSVDIVTLRDGTRCSIARYNSSTQGTIIRCEEPTR